MSIYLDQTNYIMVLIYPSNRESGILLPQRIIDDSDHLRRLIASTIKIRIPYNYDSAILLHCLTNDFNHSRTGIVECCRLLNMLDYLHCETLSYEVAWRLLDLVQASGQNRIHGRPLKFILSDSELSIRGYLLGVNRWNQVRIPSTRLTVNMRELFDYTNRHNASFKHLIRLNLDIGQTVEALDRIANRRNHKFKLACYLIDNCHLDIIRYAIDNNYGFILDVNVFRMAIGCGRSDSIIDMFINHDELAWQHRLMFALHNINPRVIKMIRLDDISDYDPMIIARLTNNYIVPHRDDKMLMTKFNRLYNHHSDDFNLNLLLTIIVMGRHIEVDLILTTKSSLRSLLTADLCQAVIETIACHYDLLIAINMIKVLARHITVAINYRGLSKLNGVDEIIIVDNNLDNCWNFLSNLSEVNEDIIKMCKLMIDKIDHRYDDRLCKVLMGNSEIFERLFNYSRIPIKVAWNNVLEDNTTHSLQIMDILMRLTS